MIKILEFDTYQVNPKFLMTGEKEVSETLCSDLLKSNCLVTGQPDWGSIQIRYTGKKIDRAGLLKYIVSFRSHSGFAEHCVERIFMDLMHYCSPQKLGVYACYTRRGGLGSLLGVQLRKICHRMCGCVGSRARSLFRGLFSFFHRDHRDAKHFFLHGYKSTSHELLDTL